MSDQPDRAGRPHPQAAPSLAEATREAYAAGWARSGGPMTTRVKAGFTAALALAKAHPHEGILEVTLKLGSLEGTWAKVYQRREALIAKHTAAVTAAWKTALTRDMLAHAVSDYRRRVGGISEDAQTDRRRNQEIMRAAVAAATTMLSTLPTGREWAPLRTALQNALAAGRAEGIVGAVAVAAEKTDQAGLDWGFAFDDALASLADLDSLWADAEGWLSRMLQRATADLARVLVNGTRTGATYAELVTAAAEALDSQDIDAVSFVVDWATTTALGQGALNLYRSQGVTAVDWITAADDHVCESPCEKNESNNPYTPDEFPPFPGHPRCRCTPSASVSLADFAAWFKK